MRLAAIINAAVSPLGVQVRRKVPTAASIAEAMRLSEGSPSILSSAQENPLLSYFERHKTGPGIFKWRHYFDIYDRHLSPFRGKPAHVLEIGVYSGGSLGMWTDYFGPNATIYGVDIEPDCKIYESGRVKISIGDQGDREFWRRFRESTPLLDVVIDDGSHRPDHQISTLVELLPHLRSGGVYICEDIHGQDSRFIHFAQELADALNASSQFNRDLTNPERRITTTPDKIGSIVESVAFYSFVAVITKRATPINEFAAAKHGTQWQPFGPA